MILVTYQTALMDLLWIYELKLVYDFCTTYALLSPRYWDAINNPSDTYLTSDSTVIHPYLHTSDLFLHISAVVVKL